MTAKFVEAIRAQQEWLKKEKHTKPKLNPERRAPLKDSAIMQILTLQELGIPSMHIAREVGVPVRTVYNVRQRYILIDVKNGTKWYKWLG